MKVSIPIEIITFLLDQDPKVAVKTFLQTPASQYELHILQELQGH